MEGIGLDGKSHLEAAFSTLWHQIAPDSPEPEHDVTFYPGRKWRADFIWKRERVLVELEGQVWGAQVHCQACGALVKKRGKGGKWYVVREAGGRHVRGDGFQNDVDKYNAAQSIGYRLFRVTAKMLDEDPYSIIMMVKEAVENGQK